MFEKHRPTEVVHLAAKVGGIIDNMNNPADFAYQNILMNSFVIHYAHKYKVKKLIATLSNCAYPDVAKKYPMTEDQFHNGLPAPTNLAYGYAKRTMDIEIKSYRKQHNCKFCSAIPGSIYGPYDKFEEGSSHFLAALIKAINWRGPLEVEIIRDSKGEYQLLEINPRFPAWIYLSVGVGRNLPFTLLQLALGNTIPEFENIKTGVMFIRYAQETITNMHDFESIVMSSAKMNNN